MAKQPKTIQEQINLLQERNMSFNDKEKAEHYLANINYYRLKGYWWEMQDDKVNHHFQDGSMFDDVIDLYNFDRRFRLIVFNAIERIEVALRTKIAYHMSLAYGPEWYLNPSLFNKQKNSNENKSHQAIFLSNLFREINNTSEEFVLAHYKNHPEEHLEAWKALEIITLGSLSKLYRNLDHQLPEKNVIAKEFGLYNQKYLSSWLMTITLLRNVIAHHSRLWNRVIINKHDWPDKTPYPLLDYLPDNYQRRKIFPILSAIIYLNDRISPGHHIVNELTELFNQFEKIPLYKMGFPNNWMFQPIWIGR